MRQAGNLYEKATIMKRSLQSTTMTRGLTSVLVMTLLLLASCAEEPKPKPAQAVKAVQIGAPDALASRTFPGRASAGKEVNLSFRVSGPLVELRVKVGDVVNQGDVLAIIDPNDFNVRLDNASSVLAAAQAAYKRAEADYARLSKARSEDPGAVSQRALDLALASRDETRSAVTAAQANTKTMRDRLSYTKLTAPFGGEIVKTYVDNFEVVLAKQPIVRLVDHASLQMTVSVPENLIGYAEYVTDIRVKFDALPGVEVPAIITEIGREASQATRTFPLTIALEQPPGGKRVLPGMVGEAAFQAKLPERAERGIHVPSTALFAGTDTSRSYVWVIENDVVQRREVEIGELTANGILVTGGLTPGEWIVAAGAAFLTDGQKVRVIERGGTL
jgi:RND family efflux transporter MFP subunit